MRDYDISSYNNTASIMATVVVDSNLAEYAPAVSYPHVSILELGEVEAQNSLMLNINLPRALVNTRIGVLPAVATGIKGYGENGMYAVLTVDSPAVLELREQVIKICKSMGIEAPATPYEFSPHISLGILEDGESLPEFQGEFSVRLSEITIAVKGMMLRTIPIF